jgi:hypothetical protein
MTTQQYVVKPSSDKNGTNYSKEHVFFDEEAAKLMAISLQQSNPIGWDVVGEGTSEIIYKAR